MDNLLMEKKVLNIDKSTWKLTKLGDLLEDISQRVDNPSQSGYDRFVGLEHFVSGDIKIKNWGTTENLTSSAKAFKAGDILFARRNAYLRRASLVDFDGCCSGDAFVLRENHDKVVPGFMAFLMNSNTVWDFANENAAGTMSKRVKWRDLANYEFLLPPKDQQAQLAELLWAMDEVIERERDVLERLELFNQSNLKILFNSTNKGRKVGNRFEIISGFPYKSKLFNTEGIGRKLMRGINIKEGGFLWNNDIDRYYDHEEGTDGKYSIKAGDVLVPMDGSKLGYNYAEATVCESGYLLVQRVALFRSNNLTERKLLMSYLSSVYFREFIKKNNTTTAIPHISMSQLKSIDLPAIDKDVEEIVDLIHKVVQLKAISETKVASSKAIQRSIINQIF